MRQLLRTTTSAIMLVLLTPLMVHAQAEAVPDNTLQAAAGPGRQTLIGKTISFDAIDSHVPADTDVREIVWDFGDGIRTTGEKVTHAYRTPGTYRVRVRLVTDEAESEDTTEVNVFTRAIVLIADGAAGVEQVQLHQQQAAEAGLLLLVVRAKSGGPEAVIEEELAQQLLGIREDIGRSDLIVTWTSGSVGINALSKFAQQIRQVEELSFKDLALGSKGIIILATTPFAVLAPTAQGLFDQTQPSYVLMSRPEILPVLYKSQSAEEARGTIVASPFEYRLLGTFSSRAVSDIGLTNFMSFGLNYLVNRGVPISNIVLILMIPVVATILSFARQFIGIKAFGLITPAMTTLAFLVLGLQAGLIVFVVVLLSGTVTRILLRRFHLLYLPRMALVLTTASLAILLMFGVGAATGRAATVSFSIFPILILILLAEEFIAAQFSRGARVALTTTAWTLFLAVACYYIVSWQLLRTILLSYPELILLAFPLNLALGRFAGLRVVEYFRFRELLRYVRS